MDTVNKKTTYFVNITFKDEDGVEVTPTAAWYNLYCETNQSAILGDTSITGLSTSVDVVVTATQNDIITSTNKSEQKLMTVRFTYDGGQYQGTNEYRWVVQNLPRIA